MSDTFWYLFSNELNTNVKIVDGAVIVIDSENIKTHVPVDQYRACIMEIANRFIGECRRNREEDGKVTASFSDLRYKLNQYFKDNFGVDYSAGAIEYPLLYQKEISVPEFYKGDDPLIIVISSRVSAFRLASDYLNEQLKQPVKEKRTRKRRIKAKTSDFLTILDLLKIVELFKALRYYEFISPDADQKTFVDIFRGEFAGQKINWIGNVYALYYFFKKIDGTYINKLNDGKWEVVSELFLVNGKSVKESSLLDPGKGKNDRTEDLDRIINSINDLESEE